jgi:hypothetical protein
LASSVRLPPPLTLALAPPLLLPWPAAFTSVETLDTAAAALSVLVPAEVEDSAAVLALETETDAEDTAAMLAPETEVDDAVAASTLVESPFWPEPPKCLAALVWRMLAQRASTYGDL